MATVAARRPTGPTQRAAGAEPRPGGTSLRLEALLALELVALSALAFSRPILAVFGTMPPMFIARDATAAQVVWFGLTVVAVPALAVVALASLARFAGRRVRELVHVALVAALAGVATWWLAFQHSPVDEGAPLLAVSAGVGATVGALRWWRRSRGLVATFLRFGAVAPLVLLVQFLVLSPTASWAFRTDRVDQATMDQVAATLGEDAPPVLVLVFDAFPTATLLDGDGRINEDLFPSIAELAGDATWYRNHTTVSLATTTAVPAIATGKYLDDTTVAEAEPENLFTLLGGAYDLRATEPVTVLCPSSICEVSRRLDSGLSRLLGDARNFWLGSVTGGQAAPDVFNFGPALGPDRLTAAEALADGSVPEPTADGTRAGTGGAAREDRPPLQFHHLLLPHRPWELTDTGAVYEPVGSQPVGDLGFFNWGDSGLAVARQRHVLQAQATDDLVGSFIDRLRREERYDEALVVLTADHGEAFVPNDSSRRLSDRNQHQLAWVPLLVKAPGQQEGRVSDDNVQSIDIVPTIAEILGIDIPWDVDGMPASQVADRRDPDEKLVIDTPDFQREAGRPRIPLAADGFERMLREPLWPSGGPDAWQRTDHAELLRRPIDELPVNDAAGAGARPAGDAATLRLASPSDLRDIDTTGPLPIEIVGETELDPGTVVAYALNGRIAALTEVEEAAPHRAHALLLPELFVDGDNDLSAYVVTGEPGDERLVALDVVL